MNDIFTVVNNRLEVIPENLNIPEFLSIWQRDTTPHKEKAKQELLYLWHMCNFKSIYRNYPKDKQEEQIIKDFIKIDKWQPDQLIKTAMERYKEFHITDEMRYLDANIYGCKKVEDYLLSVDFSERDDKGAPVYKVNEVTATLEKAGKILQSLEVLKEKVSQQMSVSTAKIRGGGNINSREH